MTQLTDFDYSIPDELIAQAPIPNRDSSRMLVLNRSQNTTSHQYITDLPDMFTENDILVVNNSKVIPARIFGKRSNGKDIELLIVEPHDVHSGVWRCLTQRAKRFRKGDQLFFGMQATAKVAGHEAPFLLMRFRGNSLDLAMKHHGVPPLPPYINRDGRAAYTDNDRNRYQTIYAKKSGSCAAPTAGLHMSQDLLASLQKKGVIIKEITLHVGIDTFTPVRCDNITEHRMHGERCEINKDVAAELAHAKEQGKRIIALGTTTTRVLESAACTPSDNMTTHTFSTNHICSGKWTTDLFIMPGYDFKVVDAIITNFHQPKSTLLMMISAFANREQILAAYNTAIQEKYRFFSYGDCMLIL